MSFLIRNPGEFPPGFFVRSSVDNANSCPFLVYMLILVNVKQQFLGVNAAEPVLNRGKHRYIGRIKALQKWKFISTYSAKEAYCVKDIFLN